MKQGKVLVLTVGTGNLNDLEGSLFAPLSKSLADGDWSEAVLLPSTVTDESADEIRKRFGTWIRVEKLPNPRMEDDYDKCFAHFDKVLERLTSEGYGADQIVVDFTRGTKAMSAAAVLAAVRRGVPLLRYIHGDRDAKGTVVAGTEQIKEVRPTLAMAHRDLDRASDLMQRGSFAAVLEEVEALAPDPDNRPAAVRPPQDMVEEIRKLQRRAEFFAAWDRLDYGQAARLSGEADVDGRAAGWVRKLAAEPDRKKHRKVSEWLCAVACDLLQNGRRRIQNQQLEDALLRGYRVLELVGQILLFRHGLDSGALDPNHRAIKRLLERRFSDKSCPRFDWRDGQPTTARENSAKLLVQLGDRFGRQLLRLGQRTYGLRARNQSILTHGFKAVAQEQRSLKDRYAELERLLLQVEPRADEMLALAQMADLHPHRST